MIFYVNTFFLLFPAVFFLFSLFFYLEISIFPLFLRFFLLNFGIVPTIWPVFILKLFRQYGLFLFWNCSDNMACFYFSLYYRHCIQVGERHMQLAPFPYFSFLSLQASYPIYEYNPFYIAISLDHSRHPT